MIKRTTRKVSRSGWSACERARLGSIRPSFPWCFPIVYVTRPLHPLRILETYNCSGLSGRRDEISHSNTHWPGGRGSRGRCAHGRQESPIWKFSPRASNCLTAA
jgi:hypothetical protein